MILMFVLLFLCEVNIFKYVEFNREMNLIDILM